MEGSPSACRLPDRVTRAQITAATRREWTSRPMRGRFHPSGAPGSLAHRTRAVDEDRTLDQSEMLASAYRLTGPGYSRNQQGPILDKGRAHASPTGLALATSRGGCDSRDEDHRIAVASGTLSTTR